MVDLKATATQLPAMAFARATGSSSGARRCPSRWSCTTSRAVPPKSNVAAANPDKVAALQKRANELAATMAKPLPLQTEFGAMLERLHMPPALPGDEASFNEKH